MIQTPCCLVIDLHEWCHMTHRRCSRIVSAQQGGEEFKGGRFDEAEVKVLFERIDLNEDGAVDREELSQFLLGTFHGRALPRPGVSGARPVRGACAMVARVHGL